MSAALTHAIQTHFPVHPSSRRLLDMLATCRPHGSRGEHDFISHFLLPYGVECDGFGNLWLRVGDAPLLWSSHVDTCHRRDGLQTIQMDDTGLIRLADNSPSNCLGADCTAGVWLMTEMIEAGVPGLYVFHRGEERGGMGSRYVAEREARRLDDFSAAIAFDRRGTGSIITHQRGERSCSDLFAASLSAAIGLDHRADPTGTFTDTANYVDLIGECTNLSVGYDCEHTAQETLDLSYLLRLRQAMLTIDTTALVFSRMPGDYELECEWPNQDDCWRPHSTSLYELVRNNPAAVADFLEMGGVSAQELEDFIQESVPF